jgi:hypothetical protein
MLSIFRNRFAIPSFPHAHKLICHVTL